MLREEAWAGGSELKDDTAGSQAGQQGKKSFSCGEDSNANTFSSASGPGSTPTVFTCLLSESF